MAQTIQKNGKIMESVNKDLFGVDIPDQLDGKPENTIAVAGYQMLIALHGSLPGSKCKECANFIRRDFAKTYFKCRKLKVSNSPTTDIRANWVACGLFEKAKSE